MPDLSLEELARGAGASVENVKRLVELGLVQPASPDRFPQTAIEHIRLAMAIEESGIPLAEVGEAVTSGRLSLAIVDRMFPEPVALTSETVHELADRIGLDEHEVRRLYVAFGLAQPQEGGRVRSDDAHLIAELVGLLAVPETRHVLIRFARLMGQPMRRITEAGTQLYDEAVIQPIVHSRGRSAREAGERADDIAANLAMLAPHLVEWLFRRHLEETLLGYWTTGAELTLAGIGAATGPDHAIAFIDLTGFAALTEQVGDVEASRLAERLTDLSEEHGSRNEGRIVKQLGDGVMLHFRRTDRAVEGVLDLVVAIREAGLPSAHAGVAAGPVIERDGDYFGRTVNLASRLADVAEAGQVIVSEGVTRVPVGHVRFEPLGDVDVQGMGREPVFLAERDAPNSSANST